MLRKRSKQGQTRRIRPPQVRGRCLARFGRDPSKSLFPSGVRLKCTNPSKHSNSPSPNNPSTPQSLHRECRSPCSQIPLPPQSLHMYRCLPCSQMEVPPQSLHRPRRLPCSQSRALRCACVRAGGALACVRRVHDCVATAAGCSCAESQESSRAFAVGRRSRTLAGAGTSGSVQLLSAVAYSAGKASILPPPAANASLSGASSCCCWLRSFTWQMWPRFGTPHSWHRFFVSCPVARAFSPACSRM